MSKFVCIRPERQGKHRRKTDKTNMRDRQAKQYGHKRQTRQTRQTGKQRRHTRQHDKQDKTGPDNNTYKIARQMRQQYSNTDNAAR